MNERKKPTPYQHKETTFSQDPIHITRRRAAALLGAGAVAAGLLAGCNTFGEKEASGKKITATKLDHYVNDKTPLESVQLENGAILREDPFVEDLSHTTPGNRLAKVELGDLPEQHSINIDFQDDDNTYIHVRNRESGTPETWIGLPEDAVKEALPGIARKLTKDGDDIIWVNTQKADYTKADR